MIALLLASIMSFTTLAEAANQLYARKDVEGLRTLCQRAETRADVLFCTYRLYPLTRDAALIDDLPTSLDDASAQEYALLSGLWGYRTADASLTGVIRYGRIAESAMREARRLDPFDPFVLLIDGQSLLFKPRIAGGDHRRALESFQRLERLLESQSAPDIDLIEAQVWIWYARFKLGHPEASALRKQLLASSPAPLYREFLLSPP